MITVVCPSYNCEKYIDRTIDCLLRQSLKPNEVIFSDDGSTDNTTEIILSKKPFFKKEKMKLILIKNKHNGPGYARNAAINKATNPWISFLDADDKWEINKIEKVTKEINKNKSINTLLHLEKFVKINGNSEILDYSIFYNNHESLSEQLYKTNFMSTSALTIKKELIDEFEGFDATLPNSQDYDLWLKMAPKIKLKIIPLVLGEYYEQEESITLRPYRKKIISILKVWFRYRNYSSIKVVLIKLFKIIINKSWIK